MSATLSLNGDNKSYVSWNTEAGRRHHASTNLAEVMSRCCLCTGYWHHLTCFWREEVSCQGARSEWQDATSYLLLTSRVAVFHLNEPVIDSWLGLNCGGATWLSLREVRWTKTVSTLERSVGKWTVIKLILQISFRFSLVYNVHTEITENSLRYCCTINQTTTRAWHLRCHLLFTTVRTPMPPENVTRQFSDIKIWPCHGTRNKFVP